MCTDYLSDGLTVDQTVESWERHMKDGMKVRVVCAVCTLPRVRIPSPSGSPLLADFR